MADFCQACSIEIFRMDCRDLADLLSEEEAAQGKVAAALCEGCGPTWVDRDGRCVAVNCSRAGTPGHGPVEPEPCPSP